ncbi:hypothetical protein A1O7_02478 [Cladophialophora yegresii CBS 114405]|uniref:F-box domain-containing protein n=1 Tax=Cladophialophora yegresii CBS 114405 TaxID=1182544 RepID=W9WAN3_9EURO|nr:uncharacterized protein A1O7_02478 [Cladophialophora yegresii CBS 114405]EXJ62045.1 hypothetical protein A1O7_02478 [Cladophialophora yegresii CBS 114405]
MVSTVKEVTAPGESQNMTTDPLETKPISVPAPPTENTQDTADDHAANLDLTQSVPVVVPSPHPLSRNSSDGKTTEGQSLSGLAPEILLEIIHHLDAPSLVCLALTSHRFYTLILQHFQVTRLSKLCPKNVRAPIPRTLRAHAYNILAPDTEAASKGWRVENLTFPPPSSTLQGGLVYCISSASLQRRIGTHPDTTLQRRIGTRISTSLPNLPNLPNPLAHRIVAATSHVRCKNVEHISTGAPSRAAKRVGK